MGNRDTDDTVRQHSGWLIPLAVFVATAVLSALFLLFYLAPTPSSFIEEHQAPTSRSDIVHLTVGDLSFAVPANYLLYASARQGGVRRQVQLFAQFPDFNGYSDFQSQTFNSNGADSPIVYMLIREEPYVLSEGQRLKRVYIAYVADGTGKPGPFGLTEYTFREDSAYRGEDLFVGGDGTDPVVMRCVRMSPEVPSPSCLRDVPLSKGVALTYRFKRAQLPNWREIAAGTAKLAASFSSPAK